MSYNDLDEPWEDGGGRGERGNGADERVLAGEFEEPVCEVGRVCV